MSWMFNAVDAALPLHTVMTPPVVVQRSIRDVPPIPDAMKCDFYASPDSPPLTVNQACVLSWHGLEYWLLDDRENTSHAALAAYDQRGVLIGYWPRQGARYFYRMEVDRVNRQVHAYGQDNACLSWSWDELAIPGPASVHRCSGTLSGGPRNVEHALQFGGAGWLEIDAGTAGFDYNETLPYCWEAWILLEQSGVVAPLFGRGTMTCFVAADGMLSATRSGQDVPLRSSAALSAQQWHHVAMTFDGAQLALYIDGNQAARGDGLPVAGVEGNIVIGAETMAASGQGPLQGQMRCVRAWSVCRSQAQLRQYMYWTILTPQAGLELCLDFRHPQWSDASGHAIAVRQCGQLHALGSATATRFSTPGALLELALPDLLTRPAYTVEGWYYPYTATHGPLLSLPGLPHLPLSLSPGRWQHVAIGWDAASGLVSVAIDGHPQQCCGPWTLAPGDPALLVGAQRDAEQVQPGFDGLIQELRVWGRRLDLVELALCRVSAPAVDAGDLLAWVDGSVFPPCERLSNSQPKALNLTAVRTFSRDQAAWQANLPTPPEPAPVRRWRYQLQAQGEHQVFAPAAGSWLAWGTEQSLLIETRGTLSLSVHEDVLQVRSGELAFSLPMAQQEELVVRILADGGFQIVLGEHAQGGIIGGAMPVLLTLPQGSDVLLQLHSAARYACRASFACLSAGEAVTLATADGGVAQHSLHVAQTVRAALAVEWRAIDQAHWQAMAIAPLAGYDNPWLHLIASGAEAGYASVQWIGNAVQGEQHVG